MRVILAPHLDDEIIGCFSILDMVDKIVYFHQDYREQQVDGDPRYVPHWKWDRKVVKGDTLFLPSKYDHHPLHREVRRIGLQYPGQHWFYSVEMNVPWLELESDPEAKRKLLAEKYPGEVETLSKNDKYFLFKSIQPFDDLIWASVRFEHVMLHRWPDAPERVGYLANLHRHKFHIQVDIQQFGDDRDVEYLMFSEDVQDFMVDQVWMERTSCEMIAIRVKRHLESKYNGRLVRVSVYEDGENGCVVE